VDWESSAATHPYYDVAAISLFFMLDAAAALGVLARQERAEVSAENIETFTALRRVAGILYGGMFFGLVPDLALVPARLDDVPTLAECYAKVRTGTLSLRTPAGKAAYGSALLRQGLEA
jgi:hypothetical protein